MFRGCEGGPSESPPLSQRPSWLSRRCCGLPGSRTGARGGLNLISTACTHSVPRNRGCSRCFRGPHSLLRDWLPAFSCKLIGRASRKLLPCFLRELVVLCSWLLESGSTP